MMRCGSGGKISGVDCGLVVLDGHDFSGLVVALLCLALIVFTIVTFQSTPSHRRASEE